MRAIQAPALAFTVALLQLGSGTVVGQTKAGLPEGSGQDWVRSAEAQFITPDEMRRWKRLASDEERERFEEEYWTSRDPDPATPENEFRDEISRRIAEADAQFSVGPTKGSSTERGKVYVLLGPPAAQSIVASPLDSAPKREGGLVVMPRTAFDARQWHTWTYGRETHPGLMKLVGRRELEISFIVQPGRGDELQRSPLFSRVREKVAIASRRAD